MLSSYTYTETVACRLLLSGEQLYALGYYLELVRVLAALHCCYAALLPDHSPAAVVSRRTLHIYCYTKVQMKIAPV